MSVFEGLIVLAALALLARLGRQVQQRKKAYTSAVALLGLVGLHSSERKYSGRNALVGEWGGRQVVACATPSGIGNGGVTVDLLVQGAAPGLSARLLGGGRAPRRAHEPLTGDLDFDGEVALEPERFEVLVSLAPVARAALLQLIHRGWTLERGDLRYRVLWSGAGGLGAAVLLSEASALLHALRAAPQDIPARFATEPDVEPRVALLCALSDYGPEFVRRTLPTALARYAQPEIAALAAALLGDGEAWDAAPRWCQVVATVDAPAAVVALHQARRDEAALISLLDRSSEALVASAIGALGAVGGRGAIEHLLPIAAGRLSTGPTANAARLAITQIQGRLGGAERGQIAIIEAPAEAGDLEIVEGAGALSVLEASREQGPINDQY